MSPTPSEVLLQRGWVKGVYENIAGNVCLERAVIYAFADSGWVDRLLRLSAVASQLFPDRIDEHHQSYPRVFNDHPDTTLEDVLLVCKHVETEDP